MKEILKTCVAIALPLVLLSGLCLMPAPTKANARSNDVKISELEFVPPDAAFFVYADAAKLWNSPLFKSIRQGDVKFFDELSDKSKKLFGASPDAVKSVTVYWPKLKMPSDMASLGIVLTFNEPYEAKQLKAGLTELLSVQGKLTLLTPTKTTAVLLANLDPATFGKTQPVEGPLAMTLREARSGQHVLVAGGTLANLPDEFGRDDVPPDFRPVVPILRSESVAAFVGLDKQLTVDVRIKSSSPPRAKEAEKALGFLASLGQEFVGEGLKELAKDMGPGIKDIAAILTAVQAGLKNAKYSTEGEITRATASIRTDLPFTTAYIAAKRKVQEAAIRAQSSNNLKQIVLAFHNYHDAMGSLPPAAVCDKNGKPLLSWRVLILPYIEASNLYKEFKLDEAWDSDHNKKLLAKMPKVYSMPTPTPAKANETHYRAFVSNGAALDYLKGPKFPQDFADGTSNTLLVVTAKDAVLWSKPDELEFDPDKDMRTLLGFFNNDACTVGMADGSVRSLNKKISKLTLHGAITRNGGEVLGEDF